MTIREAMLSIGGPYSKFVSWALEIVAIMYIIRVVGCIIIDLM